MCFLEYWFFSATFTENSHGQDGRQKQIMVLVKYVDEVKCRLRRIAHAVYQKELKSALAAFYNWEKYSGKLENWFRKT